MLANKAQKEMFAVQAGLRAAMAGSLGLRILANDAAGGGIDPSPAIPNRDE